MRGEETLGQLATRFDVHPNQITQWQGQLLERVAEVFSGSGVRGEPGPDLKTLHAIPTHPVFPYLLRGLAIDRANQVWGADIAYIPMSRGFV